MDNNQILNNEVSPQKTPVKKPKKQRRHITTATITSARIFWAILISVFVIISATFLAFYIINFARDFTGIAKEDIRIEVVIPENATKGEIADILKKNKVISTPDLFKFYLDFTDNEDPFIEGTHVLSPKMSYSDIAYELQTKAIIIETVSVTVPEGFTAEQIATLLEENYVCSADDFMYYYRTLQGEYNFEKKLVKNDLKYYQLEGYLFPDTYEFYIDTDFRDNPDADTMESAKMAADKFFSNFNSKITTKMYKRMEELGMSLNETITLASMIQKEANTEESMGLVSSVFHNRLNNPHNFPQLQSDVTIFYVTNWIQPHIPESNYNLYQEMFDAYNTYECYGLPVGPICSPGIEAINAALYPAESNYYFFVTDTKKNHFYYAETVEEHEQNIILAGLDDESSDSFE